MCLINKKMTNIRKTNSVEKLKNALIELLLEKDYSEISVSDITKKAGVSRGTFYQHFLDKDDLATTIGEKTSQKFRNILSKGNHYICNVFVKNTYICSIPRRTTTPKRNLLSINTTIGVSAYAQTSKYGSIRLW